MIDTQWVFVVVVVQLLSHVQIFVTPWTAARQAPLSSSISWSLHRLTSIELVMLSNHLILCCPLLLLLSIFPSIRESFPVSWLFTSSGQNIGTSASAIVLPMNIQGWFPLGSTGLISLLSKGLSTIQHHNLKASILRHLAFIMVQLSHLYMTTGKTIALTVRTFLAK